jgi:predicted nuclease of predicted toxin-antitoxin system
VTADKDFSDALSFRPGTHAGVILLRVPNELSTQSVNRELLRSLTALEGEDLTGLLVIVEVGRTRVRRKPRRPADSS